MSYTEVDTLINNMVAAVPGIPTIQKENTLYNTKGKALDPYARITMMPSQSTQRSVGIIGRDEYAGMHQIDLFYPMDRGRNTPSIMADAIISAVRRKVMATPSGIQVVISTAWAEVGRQDNQYFSLPVMVRWNFVA